MHPATTRRMMTTVVVLLAAGLVTPLWAHNPLDHPDWCTENGRLVVVDEFSWDGEALAAFVRKEQEDGSCSTRESRDQGTKTCGQFDDDWGIVNARAAGHCGDFAVRFEGATHRDHGTVIHIAEGPEAFNDEGKHHERYRATMGLGAMCVRCEPVEFQPAMSVGPAAPLH